MERDMETGEQIRHEEFATKQLLLESARKIFLKYGYQAAPLRTYPIGGDRGARRTRGLRRWRPAGAAASRPRLHDGAAHHGHDQPAVRGGGLSRGRGAGRGEPSGAVPRGADGLSGEHGEAGDRAGQPSARGRQRADRDRGDGGQRPHQLGGRGARRAHGDREGGPERRAVRALQWR